MVQRMLVPRGRGAGRGDTRTGACGWSARGGTCSGSGRPAARSFVPRLRNDVDVACRDADILEALPDALGDLAGPVDCRDIAMHGNAPRIPVLALHLPAEWAPGSIVRAMKRKP